MTKINTLLFDHDGTVVNTEAGWVAMEVEFTNELLKKFNKPLLDRSFFEKHSGKRFTQTLKTISDMRELQLSDEFILEAENNIIATVGTSIIDSLEIIPGVIDTLTLLKPLMHEMAIVSNADMEWLDICIPKVGLHTFFTKDRIFSASDSFEDNIPRHKPNPDIYQLAACTINKKHHECLAIEDSLTGVKAAVDAGIDVVGFVGGEHISETQKHLHGQELKALGAIKVMESMHDLPKIIQEIEQEIA